MKRAIIKLHRYWQDENQSLSNVTVLDSNNRPLFSAIGLERGWRNNERNISCIPKGSYRVVLEYSPRFNQVLWEIKDVPNRSECKFHSANYWYQLNGCIALGQKTKYINADRYLDVTNSKNTMKSFHDALKGFDDTILIITTDVNVN